MRFFQFFMKEVAAATLNYCIGLSSKSNSCRKERKLTSYSEIINHPLEVYATEDAIEENAGQDHLLYRAVESDADEACRSHLE